jgi:hypothetical protein
MRGDRGGARVAVGLAWRAQRTAAGRSKAAVGRRATRRVAGKQEVALDCSDGEQRRGAARADRQTAWHGGERPARGREGGGEAGEDAWKGAERHGGGGARHDQQEWRRRGAEKKQRREGDRRRRIEKQNPKNTATPL